MDVVIGSMTSLNEFRLVTLKHVNMKAGGSEKWKPPTIGTVKINVDGSFFQNTNIGSSRFVVRDSNGRFLVGGQSYQGVISAEHVEAFARKQAVQFAIMHNFVPAVIETDAQGVYLQLLNNQQNNFSILGRLYDDIGLFFFPSLPLLRRPRRLCLRVPEQLHSTSDAKLAGRRRRCRREEEEEVSRAEKRRRRRSCRREEEEKEAALLGGGGGAAAKEEEEAPRRGGVGVAAEKRRRRRRHCLEEEEVPRRRRRRRRRCGGGATRRGRERAADEIGRER
ncbi:hypothetical protein ACLB2K_077187 [Fragaria x ananassa]